MMKYENMICFEVGSILFSYPLEHFYMKKEVSRSRFNDFFESFRNRPKNIGICPATLISHLGIIKTPEIQTNIIKNTRRNRKSPNSFAVFWALLDFILGPIKPL